MVESERVHHAYVVQDVHVELLLQSLALLRLSAPHTPVLLRLLGFSRERELELAVLVHLVEEGLFVVERREESG